MMAVLSEQYISMNQSHGVLWRVAYLCPCLSVPWVPIGAFCSMVYLSPTFSIRTSILLLAPVILAPNRKYTSQKTPLAPLCECNVQNISNGCSLGCRFCVLFVPSQNNAQKSKVVYLVYYSTPLSLLNHAWVLLTSCL